ncbi:MAG: hypothetical protein HZA35_01305 [Parcubacteria group bacterium]|nr:hypothetical protein [Parcubacteria group bacterium]
MRPFFFITLANLYLLPGLVFGAEFTGLENPIESENFNQVIDGVVGFLKAFGAAVLVIFILYGGFQYLTSGGDPTKHKKGTETLKWAAIGFGIIFSVDLIQRALREFF